MQKKTCYIVLDVGLICLQQNKIDGILPYLDQSFTFSKLMTLLKGITFQDCILHTLAVVAEHQLKKKQQQKRPQQNPNNKKQTSILNVTSGILTLCFPNVLLF